MNLKANLNNKKPKVEIRSIDRQGLLILQFSSELTVPANYKLLSH